MRFHHAAINVLDLQTSVSFYEKLGFTKVETYCSNEERAAFLKKNGMMVELIEEVTTRSLPVRLSGHLAFEIDHLERFLREYRTVFTKVERYTLHGTQVAYAIGPNGEEVEWIEKMRLSNNEPH
ncbi:VOC family protein [Bacillus sp. RAR_GA_16]|uniref:VOC family protein n=1 Tax=Bacillus sp. RAR_GA_16 TaxID=2876774 RepID=UPI001CCFEBAD|nr:VOC family protein [Bacillus sp. RAR_GA_16]MCA0173773.1 VOC family protein [Bacillus sp. RAR_GA_16]